MKKNNLRFKNNIKSDSNNQNRNLSSRKQPKEVVFDLQEDYNRIPYNIQQPESIHPNGMQESENNEIPDYIEPIHNNILEKETTKQHQDVDNLVSQFIPDYHEKVAIELKNVSLSFKITNDKIDNLKEYVIRTIKRNKEKSRKFKALDNVSFKIYQGEKVGVIGFNGAGKSTLLKIVSGVYDCDSGEVTTNGIIAPLLSLGAGFDYNYSGKDNIFLNGAILGYTEDFLKSKYDEILEFSELGEFIDVPIKNYSSGMKARLGFSIATLVSPDILILDEVLSVGDAKFRKKSEKKVLSMFDKGVTVLFVSHSLEQVQRLCNKAMILEKGKLIAYGDIDEISAKYTEMIR